MYKLSDTRIFGWQLQEDGSLDWEGLETAVRPETQCALIQRSCGYSWRKTLTVAEIEAAIIIIKVRSAR